MVGVRRTTGGSLRAVPKAFVNQLTIPLAICMLRSLFWTLIVLNILHSTPPQSTSELPITIVKIVSDAALPICVYYRAVNGPNF